MRIHWWALVGIGLVFGCDGTLTARVTPGTDAGPDVGVDTVGMDIPVVDGALDVGADALVDAAPRVDGGNPLPTRVSNDTCRLPEAPPPGDFATEVAFAGLSFSNPVWVGTAPGDNTAMYVVEKEGTIRVFDHRPDADTATTFLDVDVPLTGGEEGLLGLAFHPNYGANGRLFVYYSSNNGCPGGGRCSVISEFARMSARAGDPGSEQVLLRISQPFSNHNGGDLQFGPDGMLYISVGDGGSGGDPMGNGQNTNTLLGNILRVDVDTVPAGDTYGIPSSNPFAVAGGREEIYAWGLRNPWRMSFDRVTGALWAGDVGQGAFEEIDKITEPGNFGWNVREGFECYSAASCADTFVDPVYAYGRGDGRSVTGGVVYRGSAFRELFGHYFFGDFASNRIWRLEERAGMAPLVTPFAMGTGGVAAFGQDEDGEIFIADFSGRILTFTRSGGEPGDEIPMLLSDTGCFTDTTTLEMAPGVVPYELNLPFWSDGGDKQRFIALPGLETATPTAEGSYDFPEGTVLIKTFTVNEAGRPEPRRIETRLLAHQSDGWRGFTWRWNDAQDDAVLLAGAMVEDIETADGTLSWNYPSRAECQQCHTDAANSTLGLTTRQLNRDLEVAPGTYFSQLAALTLAGYLENPGDPAALPAHPSAGGSVEDRARAYLDANCAMCHLPGGPGVSDIDLRVQTPFADMGVCDAVPGQGDLGIADARIVAAGDPSRSVLHARVNRRGEDQMPPLASSVIDEAGAALLSEWITAAACP